MKFSADEGIENKRKNLRIVHALLISHVSSKYGGGRCFLNLIEGLRRKNIECYAVIPSKGPLEEELQKRGIKYHIVPLKVWTSITRSYSDIIARLLFNIFSLAYILLLCRKYKINIIYTNSIIIFIGALAAKILGKPHIWHVIEFAEEDYGLSFDLGLKNSMKVVNFLSTKVIFMSYALEEKFLRYLPKYKCKVIYDGIFFDDKQTLRPKYILPLQDRSTEFILVIIGYLHEGKGHIDAILAVATLVKQGLQVKLNIVGEGNRCYKDKLKSEVTKNEIEGYVNFVGYLDDPTPIRNKADVVLVCSRSEAFGLVTVEAMLAGKPVIGTRAGATKELIKETYNGLLYEPGNYNELAEKIKYLIDNPEKLKTMGENGFCWAISKFTIEEYAESMVNVLTDAIN